MLNFLKFFFGLLIVVLLIIAGAIYFESFLTRKEVEITILKVDEMFTPENEKYYLIHTKDEIFENRNYYLHNKDYADALQNKLLSGNKYRIVVVGFNFESNIPLFLEHRNVVDVIAEIKIIRPKVRRLNEF
ncbi:MAG: hypothetical protein KKB34_17920 [Bacteroidetes bacterium]|jgi:hypothetical protein|nr:hypothetical protein [Bacteroidota bacterium]